MKVALLSDCYLPRLGGIEVQVHDLARGLRAQGHQAEVVTATRGPAGAVDGVPAHRFALPLPGGVPVNPLAPPRVRELLRDGGFDVAHVHLGVVSPFAADCVRVALGLGLPTVLTWHCVLAHAAPLVGATGSVRRWARQGAVLTAVSRVAAAPLHRLSGGAPVDVLPNGIDLARWTPGDPQERPDAPVEVVTAMRLARRKRPLGLLRVMEQARAQAPHVDLRLTVLGEGPWRGRLEHWVRRHDAAGWVDLPGRQTREQLHERYRSAGLYVAPARLEAFGIAALEARASGLPVVGPAMSGISEFVTDGVDGLLVPDDARMASALARLGRDDGLRHRMQQHNASTPVAQDWPTVVTGTIDAYRRAGGPD